MNGHPDWVKGTCHKCFRVVRNSDKAWMSVFGDLTCEACMEPANDLVIKIDALIDCMKFIESLPILECDHDVGQCSCREQNLLRKIKAALEPARRA